MDLAHAIRFAKILQHNVSVWLICIMSCTQSCCFVEQRAAYWTGQDRGTFATAPNALWGRLLFLPSRHFYGTNGCAIHQRETATNPKWLFFKQSKILWDEAMNISTLIGWIRHPPGGIRQKAKPRCLAAEKKKKMRTGGRKTTAQTGLVGSTGNSNSEGSICQKYQSIVVQLGRKLRRNSFGSSS